MTHLSEELQQRMVALIGRMARNSIQVTAHGNDDYREAQDIAALLPDPDLEAARKIAVGLASTATEAATIASGRYDNDFPIVQAALAGIKHARTQAKE